MVENTQKPIMASLYAYNNIKSLILTGECLPGERVNQDEIARNLGLSRLPIRQALDKLAADGLVQLIPRRGAIVSPISIENLNHIFSIRSVLEPIAVIDAINNAEPADLEKIKELLDSQIVDEDNLESVLQQNRDFHFAIFALAKNEPLLRILESLWDQSNRYRRIYFANRDFRIRISDDHHKILEDMIAGDKHSAVERIVSHTKESQKILLKAIFDKDVLPPETVEIKAVNVSAE